MLFGVWIRSRVEARYVVEVAVYCHSCLCRWSGVEGVDLMEGSGWNGWSGFNRVDLIEWIDWNGLVGMG